MSSGNPYPLVGLGPTREIELSFSNILRLPFEFVPAVGDAVKGIVRVRDYSDNTISLDLASLERKM